MEIEVSVHKKITELSSEGESFFENEDYSSALVKYKEALELVPKPKADWEAGLWLYSAIGDCYYAVNEFDNSRHAFHEAYNCSDGKSNPFVCLRLGQSYFELENFQKADEYLMRAYMLEGKKIFKGENKKYVNHLRKKYDL